MTVAVTIDSKDGSTYVVTVAGTAAEVGAELATGAVAVADTAGTAWDGSERSFMGLGGDATACIAIYLAKKHH